MPFNKLIIKMKKFYRQIFNPHEDEINLDTFTKFALLSFLMIFFDYQHLNENASLKIKFNYYAKKFFNMFAIVSLFVASFQIIMFGIVNSANFNVVIRAISDTSAVSFITVKGLILFLRKDNIREILEGLKTLFESRDNGHEKPVKMILFFVGHNRVMKIYAAIFISVNLVCVVFWLPYLTNGSVYFLTNFWFPFDENNVTMFPFVQLWTQWITYLTSSFLVASNSLIYALVTIISMEFDLLKKDLKFIKLKTKNELSINMACFIDRHNKLFEISEKVKFVFEPIFLFNFLISSFIMCVASFQLLSTLSDSLTYMIDIVYLATFASQIWLLCSLGQKLINSSLAVSDEIYGCNWTDLDDNKFKKQLIIVMVRAQRPMKLTAMGFVDISLETFAAVKC